MKSLIMKTSIVLFALVVVLMLLAFVFAPFGNITYAEDSQQTQQQETKNDSTGMKAIAAAIAVGVAAGAGAIAMGIAIAKSNDSISRQPESSGKITSNMMLGLVFIETAIIYALIVAILVVFVL